MIRLAGNTDGTKDSALLIVHSMLFDICAKAHVSEIGTVVLKAPHYVTGKPRWARAACRRAQ